jgi:hypothetical protein
LFQIEDLLRAPDKTEEGENEKERPPGIDEGHGDCGEKPEEIGDSEAFNRSDLTS